MNIKICGLTRLADAQVAVESGADLLGFIFYPKSKRYIAPEAAAAIIAKVPWVPAVGVFVNESEAHIRQVAGICGLGRVQLHGDEQPELVAALADLRPIKVVPLRADAAGRLGAYGDSSILVDTPCQGWGGSGEAGDWELAASWARGRELILSGGLRPTNVADAIARVQPAGVDVASGVERAPGVKDPGLIRAFIRAVRETE